MVAFWTLSTERPTSDKTVGPIPWSKVRQYAREELGLEPELLNLFWRIISAMDGAFLEWQGNEHARYIRSRKVATKPAAGGKTKSTQSYGR